MRWKHNNNKKQSIPSPTHRLDPVDWLVWFDEQHTLADTLLTQCDVLRALADWGQRVQHGSEASSRSDYWMWVLVEQLINEWTRSHDALVRQRQHWRERLLLEMRSCVPSSDAR